MKFSSHIDLSRLRHTGAADARVGVGFDFGTSNSAAAVFDGRRVSVVPLERDALVMPSATYIDKDFSVETGQRAIADYIEQNRGRRVEFRAEVLGEARLSTGQIDRKSELPSTADTVRLYGREVDDAGLPGRLFHGVKRLLAMEQAERVTIFGKPFRLVALMTPIMVRMTRSAQRVLHAANEQRMDPAHGCLGHPVRFEGNDGSGDDPGIRRLSEAWGHAGIPEQRFCPEPIAAAISYIHANAIAQPCRILTVDFGGGTLDLCVIRCDAGGATLEAVHGIALGGNVIDQTIVRELIFPLLGAGERWRRMADGKDVDTPFPFWKYENYLLNWHVGYLLNQNEYTFPVADRMRAGGEAARKFERLYQLITQNLAFEMFQAVKAAKERLSEEEVVQIDIPDIDVSVRLDRLEFQGMLGGHLRRFEEAIEQTLANAGLSHGNIDLVLRTGGSALIPAFAAILERGFPGRVVRHDPFTGVAAGLAIADYYGIGNSGIV